jgi:hypothetical protein
MWTILEKHMTVENQGHALAGRGGMCWNVFYGRRGVKTSMEKLNFSLYSCLLALF